MLEGFLLGAAFVAGQSPVPAPMPPAPGTARVQAVAPAPAPAAPMKMPGVPGATPAPAAAPNGATYAPAPGGTTYAPATSGLTYAPSNGLTYGAPGADCATCQPAAEGKADEAPTYFFMNLFADRPAGRWMKCNNVNIYGWTEVSYNGSTASRTNLPITMYDQANQWQMNQNWLHLDKSIDMERKEFQLGGTADLILPGTDARYTISRNLLDSQLSDAPSGGPREYPIDLFQAYGEAFLPGFGPQGSSVKFGKFQTIVGYEMVQAPLTPFLGRSFLFQYNPFTHSGALVTTPLNDTWTVFNGGVIGSDNFFGDVARPTYLGGIRWAPKDGATTAQFNTVITDPTYDANDAFPFYNVYNLVVTHKINECFNYAADLTYSHIDGAPGVGFADWYGAAQYLFWKHTDKLTSQFRMELFNDSEGFRTGTRGLYTSPTYGLAWAPTDWALLRPSIQYAYNPNGPFEGDRDIWIGAMDFILRW